MVLNDILIGFGIAFSVIIVLIILVFGIAYPFFKKKYMYRNFKNIYYKKVKAICDINDYYLINKLVVTNKKTIICRIDHVIFSNKYIYVIKDRYYNGAISGDKEDAAWIFYNSKGEKQEIPNPMNVNTMRIDKLAKITNIDLSFFISIVLINNDAVIKNPKDLNSKSSFITSTKRLKRLISSIEKRDIKNIDPVKLEYAVHDIYKLYGKGREIDGEE
ncbi:MAG TPA: NERD domain-containing protein [Candidatus Onthovivens sp.]|nr:NERD domain-containing protein [Candidatus Onthovivens sp.]